MARNERKRRGNGGDERPSKRQCVKYDRERARKCVHNDYFSPTPRFNDYQFERFFRIPRAKAEHIIQRLAADDRFWVQTIDCCGRMSSAPEVKLVAALKMLCYGESFVSWQDYCQMGETTGGICCSKLLRRLVLDPELGGKYLRKMTKHDAMRVEQMHYNKHGIHGDLGSLDVYQICRGACARLPRKASIREGEGTLHWAWRLHAMQTCGFGIGALVLRAPSMTSMCGSEAACCTR